MHFLEDTSGGPNRLSRLNLTIYQGELFDLEALSRTCKELNRYSFFVTSMPLNMPGGVSSPPNASKYLFPSQNYVLLVCLQGLDWNRNSVFDHFIADMHLSAVAIF
jgi:hypothetical protein